MKQAEKPSISLHRILWTRVCVLVSSFVLLVGLVFFLFGLEPMLERIAESQFSLVASEVETSLDRVFEPAEQVLSMSQGWIDGEAPDLDDPTAFNRLFRPVLESLPQATSVVAGSSAGEGWLLLQQADGSWSNRMTDLKRWGSKHLFFKRGADGIEQKFWKPLDYDPRSRSWYQVAIENTRQVQWTAPYTFFTTGDPGITASRHLALRDGRDFVIGLDLKLRDLSLTTMKARVGQHGMAVVLTEDLRVLALPEAPAGVEQNIWLGKVLTPGGELGIGPLRDALENRGPDFENGVEHYRSDGEAWLTRMYSYRLGKHQLWIVALAPAADFAPGWFSVAGVLLAGLVFMLLLTALFAQQQARRIAHPLEALAAASERFGRLDFASAPLAISEISEVRQLTAAYEKMRTLLLGNYQQLAAQEDELRSQIVALRSAEEKISESESYNKILFADTYIPLAVLDPATGLLVDCNQAAANIYRQGSCEEMLGVAPLDVSAPFQYDGTPSAQAAEMKIQAALAQGAIIFEWRHRRPDGTEWDAEVHLMSFCHGGQKLLQLTLQDISERKQAEKYEQFRSHILESLASDETLASILEAIVVGVQALKPAMLCSIVLLDRDGRHLGKGVAPSLPDFYNAAIVGIEIGIGVGSCGTAAFTGQPVIVDDIATHPYWVPYKALAARAGLGACWSQPILAASGRVLGTFAIYHQAAHTPVESDIFIIEQSARLASIAIERKQSEEKLQLAASVFTHALEGILISDANGLIIDVNDSFTRITGYGRDEVVGLNPRILSSGRHDKSFYAALWRDLIEKGHWYGEVWNRRKNGDVYAEMKTISAVRDASGKIQHYVALFSDITTLKAHETQLEHMAHYDVLTMLPNRVLLADRLRQALAQANRQEKRLAVIYLDLDGFKEINDKYGHEIGDRLLIILAERMKQTLREEDTFARLGGDEFVAVLLGLANVEASQPMLARLLTAAAQPVPVADFLLQVSASLGVTFYPQAEEVDADQLLRQADQAMYQAKLAGKNRHHIFDAELDRSARGHHESLERIRCALMQNEFVLHYQPKVNMRTGQVIGAEALIRWQHPERGLLPPVVFLPVIENHLLAVKVGEWVIDTALSQIEHWRMGGLDIPVSVNVSAHQLQDEGFVDYLRTVLAAHPAIRPDDLEIEVLETSALEDLARISQIIEACRELGVMFALDDFGTGYSSLTYLKHLSVNQLKIDQSFVRDMLDDPDDLAILGGVLSLATAFRRQVIAEGVETVAHGTMLLQLGCELAQGYGIARPMPAADFPAWATAWRPDSAWSNQPSVDRDDLPLLFACVEHRAWIVAVEEVFRGERETLPLVHHQCHFGSWLKVEGQTLHAGQPTFLTVESLHRKVHALAEELLAIWTQERNPEVLARLDELHDLRDALIEQLQALVQEGR